MSSNLESQRNLRISPSSSSNAVNNLNVDELRQRQIKITNAATNSQVPAMRDCVSQFQRILAPRTSQENCRASGFDLERLSETMPAISQLEKFGELQRMLTCASLSPSVAYGRFQIFALFPPSLSLSLSLREA